MVVLVYHDVMHFAKTLPNTKSDFDIFVTKHREMHDLHDATVRPKKQFWPLVDFLSDPTILEVPTDVCSQFSYQHLRKSTKD